MKHVLSLVGLTMGLMFCPGCATPPSNTGHNEYPSATCYVCRYNNDLACVRIKVKDTTPRTEFHATTYYFCSEDCRAAFLKNSQKYLPKEDTVDSPRLSENR
jgi:YHS domain-containing protein